MAKIWVVGALPDSLTLFRGPMLKGMLERGHEVIASAAGGDVLEGLTGADPIVKLSDMGIQFRPIPLSRTGTNPIQDLRLLIYLMKVLREIRPDHIFTYTVKPNVYVSLASRLTKVGSCNSMITGVGTALAEPKARKSPTSKLLQTLLKLALKQNQCVLFQNPDDQNLFLELGLVSRNQKMALVAGSGVDLTKYVSSPVPLEPLTLLCIGRLLYEKGMREYFEAASELKRKYPASKFVLIGPADNHPSALQPEELRHWQDSGVIDYLGSQSDVRPHLAACSVYVLPSYREGTPRTVLEAMATGRAVVTTDAPGCRQTIQDGLSGFLVPPKDSGALVQAMEKFLINPELAVTMGAESLRRVREVFEVGKVNEAIFEAMGI